MAFAAILMTMGWVAILVLPVLFAAFVATFSVGMRSMRRRASMEIGSAISSLFNVCGAPGATVGETFLSVPRSSVLAAHALRIRCRIAMGQDLGRASAAEAASGNPLATALYGVEDEYARSGTISRALVRLGGEASRSRALEAGDADGKQQRYAVMGAVCSAVLPSVILFGFVGYSMFAYSGVTLALFSVALLVVVPSVSMCVSQLVTGVYP